MELTNLKNQSSLSPVIAWRMPIKIAGPNIKRYIQPIIANIVKRIAYKSKLINVII